MTDTERRREVRVMSDERVERRKGERRCEHEWSGRVCRVCGQPDYKSAPDRRSPVAQAAPTHHEFSQGAPALESTVVNAPVSAVPETPPKGKLMTDAQIKYMVDRFLAWRLPENFNPDGGISFKPLVAEQMVRHMVEGLPAAPRQKALEKELEEG